MLDAQTKGRINSAHDQPDMMECVPNFSTGDCPRIFAEISSSIGNAISLGASARLVNSSRDADHNRSVFSIIGTPTGVLTAVLHASLLAVKLLDMRRHHGEHPRLGAVDVVPFIPLGDTSWEEAMSIARQFGKTFSAAANVPIYYYGAAATTPAREELAKIRAGGYEALAGRLRLEKGAPDEGVAEFNAKSGATAVGVRAPLVAFNVNLDTSEIFLARKIAGIIRESKGGLPGVRAIGVQLKSRGLTQVSTNITDYRRTTMKQVFDAVRTLALADGVGVWESELIGLAPRNAWGAEAREILLRDFSPQMVLEHHLEMFAPS